MPPAASRRSRASQVRPGSRCLGLGGRQPGDGFARPGGGGVQTFAGRDRSLLGRRLGGGALARPGTEPLVLRVGRP